MEQGREVNPATVEVVQRALEDGGMTAKQAEVVRRWKARLARPGVEDWHAFSTKVRDLRILVELAERAEQTR